MPRRPGPGQSRRVRIAATEEVSAGGVVVRGSEAGAEVVLIGKRDRSGGLVWSLPKGHVEAGETVEDAAVREVAEETGITATVVTELGTIDYWFVADGGRVHKTVHHFMLAHEGGRLSAADGEVELVGWFSVAEATERLEYADERALLDRLAELLTESA